MARVPNFLMKSQPGCVYVMRHGRTVLDDLHRSDGWLDYPLSDEGRKGLIHAQQYLKMSPISKVFAPSLRRAHESAHIVASGIMHQGQPPTIHTEEAAKTWHLGALVGGKKKPNKPQVRYYMDNPHVQPLGGESMNEFMARWIPWILDCAREAAKAKTDYLVVTSGSNLRALGEYLHDDTDVYDLDESGMICLRATKDGKVDGEVVFGHKDGSEDWS